MRKASSNSELSRKRPGHALTPRQKKERSAPAAGPSFALFAEGGDSQEQPHVWQRRFYDFNVWSERKRVEKLRYMRNPVKDGLVAEPEDWEWVAIAAIRSRKKAL